jgi:hypothetical protein
VLNYVGLIVLVIVALVLGLLLACLTFLHVLSVTDNFTAATFAAFLAALCVVLSAVLLICMIQS